MKTRMVLGIGICFLKNRLDVRQNRIQLVVIFGANIFENSHNFLIPK